MTAELTDASTREDWGRQRSRTVTWREPGPSTAKGLSMPGIDYLRAMAAGELPQPPIAGLMRFDIVSADPGRVVFTCEPDESAYNPIGAVHGGLVCTLLDSVTGCAIHSTLPQGKGYTTLELKVNMIRPITDKTGPVRAEGRIIHTGNQTAISEGSLFDSNGKLYASATTTCLIFDIS